jgi:hypothetical protein
MSNKRMSSAHATAGTSTPSSGLLPDDGAAYAVFEQDRDEERDSHQLPERERIQELIALVQQQRAEEFGGDADVADAVLSRVLASGTEDEDDEEDGETRGSSSAPAATAAKGGIFSSFLGKNRQSAADAAEKSARDDDDDDDAEEEGEDVVDTGSAEVEPETSASYKPPARRTSIAVQSLLQGV